MQPARRWATLSLVWMDDKGIREENTRWFGKDSITDVISFGYAAQPGDNQGDEGELIINLEQAWHEGLLRGNPQQELALYLAHGIDHIHGSEDDTPAKKRAMLHREKLWVGEAARIGLVQDLFAPRTRSNLSNTSPLTRS